MSPKQPTKHNFTSNPFTSCFDGISELFKTNQTPAIIILVFSVFGIFLNFLTSLPFPNQSVEPAPTTTSIPETNSALIAMLIVGIVIAITISVVLSVLYTGVVNYVTWKTSRGESTDFGEALRASFRHFWRILGIQIIVGIKVLFGLFLFIVPGIRAALRYQLVFIAMYDENLSIFKSMDRVKFLARQHLIEIFGIMTVAKLLFPATALLQMGGFSMLYPGLKNLKDNDLPKPQTHWLNYIGIFIIGFIALFVIGLLMLLVSLYSKAGLA